MVYAQENKVVSLFINADSLKTEIKKHDKSSV